MAQEGHISLTWAFVKQAADGAPVPLDFAERVSVATGDLFKYSSARFRHLRLPLPAERGRRRPNAIPRPVRGLRCSRIRHHALSRANRRRLVHLGQHARDGALPPPRVLNASGRARDAGARVAENPRRQEIVTRGTIGGQTGSHGRNRARAQGSQSARCGRGKTGDHSGWDARAPASH